jgi:hypothetical protein
MTGSLERALGRKPESLKDFVMAQLLFSARKHYWQGDPDPEDTARDRIKHWSNEDLLDAISLALDDMKEDENV